MQFVEYSSIKSETNGSHVEKIRRIFGNKEFVVLEKIHGANFQFSCQLLKSDTDNDVSVLVKCAKRTSILEEDESFYGWQIVRDRYASDIAILCTHIHAYDPTITHVHVFGELFGGIYPGEPAKTSLKPVQKGIYYSPDIDFIIFDIALRRDTDPTPKFMSYTDAVKYVEKTKTVRHVPLRFRGNFSDALKFSMENTEFITTIPKLYELKDLESNFAEGNVMKADIITEMGEHRGILKIKHPKFNEMIGYNPNKIKTSGMDTGIISDIEYHKEQLKCFLTQNRLDAVVSKYGPTTPRPKLVGCFLNDAKEDYMKTMESDEDQIEKINELWKYLYKSLINSCNSFSYPEN